MKQINNYIFEKLKINSNTIIINDFREDKVIQTLGEIIANYFKEESYDEYIKDYTKLDKYFFKHHQSYLYKYIHDKHWFYGRNINERITKIFMDIINDKISKEELYNIQQNLIIGFKNTLGIKESFEENTFWKIDKYFDHNDDERKLFIDIVDYFRDNPSYTTKDVKEYIKDKDFKNFKKFIDFLDDIIKSDTTDRDYNHILYMLIKRIIGDKQEGNKYTNKKE